MTSYFLCLTGQGQLGHGLTSTQMTCSGLFCARYIDITNRKLDLSGESNHDAKSDLGPNNQGQI